MKKKNILKHEEIKLLIKESDLSFKEIAAKTNSHINTVYNINKGRTHFDLDESYPLRSRDGDRIKKLISKLSIPTLDAIPFSSTINLNLLDYISMLSFLKVDISCLLLFKHLYLDDIVESFNFSPTDEQLISIFKLKPQQPENLSMLLDAYYEPQLSLRNLDYWEESGFLTAEERKDIFKIFSKI